MIYLILFLGLVLRLIGLNQSFWLDEGTSGIVARDLNFPEFFNFIKADFHPPLYYLFLKYWGMIFGYSEISLRMPSVIFGVLTIIIVYKIALFMLRSTYYARLSALLMAISGLHIYYSQEARMYSLSTLLVSLIVYYFLRLLKNPKKSDWFFYFIFLVLNFYTDYLPNLILIVIWLYGLIVKRDNRKFLKKFVICHLIFLVFTLPWLPVFIFQLQNGMEVKENLPLWWSLLGNFSFKNLGLIPMKFLVGRISYYPKSLYYLIVLLTGIIASVPLYKSLKKKNLLLWSLFLGPIILGILFSLKLSILVYFRFLFVLPFLYLLLGSVKTKFVWIFIICNLLFSSVYLLNSSFHREDWKSLVYKAVLENAQIIMPARSQTEVLQYYNYQSPVNPDKIYLVRYLNNIFDPKNQRQAELEKKGYKKSAEFSLTNLSVWVYEK